MNLDDYEFQKPGRIVEYFPATQTATVKISNDRTFSTSNDTNLQVEQVLLYDVPVFTAGGGGWHMTFPIKPDDPCLLSFSEFGYDHWFSDNTDAAGIRFDGNPQSWTARKFSLDDGFAQVGWNNLPTAIESYHATHSQWRNAVANQVISLNDDTSITITSPISVTVNAPAVTVNGSTVDLNTSAKITMTCPEVEITGNLLVGGDITGLGSAFITAAVTAASSAFTGAMVSLSAMIGGINMTSHTHDENNIDNAPTQPPN
tara:strand:- start:15840 stop:16616 length:777 start_codon:yes stop_codon:yes gene_type:complete